MRFCTALTAFAVAVTAQQSLSTYTQASSTYTQASSITSALSSQSTARVNGTSTASEPVTHTVLVAKGGHSFSPDVTLAEVGDTIEFDFFPTNHSVIRAAYGYACVPYEMALGVGHYGVWSGWKPVDAVLSNPPKWSVRVNDSEPIFFYCGAPGSCIGYGMVGVINPNANTSLQHQRQLAQQSTFVLVPGEDWPSEGSIPSGVATTSTTTAKPTATSAPATTTTAVAVSPGGSTLGAGAIAGIAIGGAAVLLGAGVAIWFCGRQSKRSKTPTPVAPAQEVMTGYNTAGQPMYAKHMSTVSGYTMPPNYDPMRSPVPQPIHSPVDPMMEQNAMLNSGIPSPQMRHTSPAPVYGQGYNANIYAPGMHHVAPVEMSSDPRADGRKSTEKAGVERYS